MVVVSYLNITIRLMEECKMEIILFLLTLYTFDLHQRHEYVIQNANCIWEWEIDLKDCQRSDIWLRTLVNEHNLGMWVRKEGQ